MGPLLTGWRLPLGFSKVSIPGPLLFIIYINDIKRGLYYHKSLLPDDITILYPHTKVVTHFKLTWIAFRMDKKWQLSLNITKCNVMSITNKKFTYHVINVPLEWVDTYTYLWVMTYQKLNWGDHIAKVSQPFFKKVKKRTIL